MQSKVQADLVVAGARDGKANQIALYDLREKSSLADYVMICEGRSHPHCRGIAEKIQEKLKLTKIRPLGIEGEMEGTWILLDYGDVIAHIFHLVLRSCSLTSLGMPSFQKSAVFLNIVQTGGGGVNPS